MLHLPNVTFCNQIHAKYLKMFGGPIDKSYELSDSRKGWGPISQKDMWDQLTNLIT